MISKIIKLIKYHNEARMALSSVLRLAEGDANARLLGGLTEEETAGLIAWLPERGTFVEFGTLFGLTAKAIAAARPNLRIVAIDNFSWNPFGLPPEVHEAFTRRILANEIAGGQVEVRNTTSVEFRTWQEGAQTIDAVFFDALHQYEPVRDEIAWAKAVGVGVIAGHDYGNPLPACGVTRAVDEAFGRENVEVVGMCWRAAHV